MLHEPVRARLMSALHVEPTKGLETRIDAQSGKSKGSGANLSPLPSLRLPPFPAVPCVLRNTQLSYYHSHHYDAPGRRAYIRLLELKPTPSPRTPCVLCHMYPSSSTHKNANSPRSYLGRVGLLQPVLHVERRGGVDQRLVEIQNEHELALLEQGLLVPARNLLCFLWEFSGNKSVHEG